MFGLLKKVFGTAQIRKVKKYKKIVKQINQEEQRLQALSDDELKAKTVEFKKRLANGEPIESLRTEAFAVVKNTCRRLVGSKINVCGFSREWDMIPYDVQLVGALALSDGSIAEMQTGEGKTLTATLPLYLYALTGKPVHLVTVNDYLAKRDCEWGEEIFRFHDITVKPLVNDTPLEERHEVYQADIVYGTASEFGFDYLRDNAMATEKEQQTQRGYYYTIVDEIDSILIDEARTPLIISGPVPESLQMYDTLNSPVQQLVKKQKEECQSKAQEAHITLQKLELYNEEPPKLSKEAEKEKSKALKELWLVSKGTPKNKLLKRVKEHPDLRADLDNIHTYFYSEQNKEERLETLKNLHIIVDERSNDYELTDKGIEEWIKVNDSADAKSDFLLFDLTEGYEEIENSDATEEEKHQKRTALHEKDQQHKERSHNIRQLFRAHLLMEKDIDYIKQDNQIVIIDEHTGRPQPGRRFSNGLHQAIEAKESVEIQQETQTFAQTTLQNYFRMYERLSGMTGTAITEAHEFKQIYKLEVLQIPTHKKCIRKDKDDLVFMTAREKYQALLKEIHKIHTMGAPILIGTDSVETSELVSTILRRNKLKHTILNAKNHEREAEIIAEAGQEKAITVATNMAGRGTDIKLGDGVEKLGGLHIIGVTRHQSRRIDRQLRGRSGRQGDNGCSQFFLSFEDPLMRLFASPRISMLLQRMRPPEGEPIQAKILNKSIETAQKRVEQRNFSIRKHTLEYDDVMNLQREEVYKYRNSLLSHDNPLEECLKVLDEQVQHFHEDEQASLIDYFPLSLDQEKCIGTQVKEAFKQKVEHELKLIASLQKLSKHDPNPLPDLQHMLKSLIVQVLDKEWQEHLLAIDHLREEVSFQTVAQKDPLIEFKNEAFRLFESFSKGLIQGQTRAIFGFQMGLPPHISNLESAVKKTYAQMNNSFLSQAHEELFNNTTESLPQR